ncbi:MAG: recombination mediator RecR [Alphaproteobacteria bacterium]|nr:recombination mediator RecR [Alphaproteobacteria bacterium]
MRSNAASPIETLVRQLAGLPGLGSRSARRIALHLLQRKDDKMLPLAFALQDAAEKIKNCMSCGNLDMSTPCHICADDTRDLQQICIVSQVSDLWAIERTGAYRGRYFVLGGLLSALDGIGPDDLGIERLLAKLAEERTQEVILALSATVNGQSTAHYIADQIAGVPDLSAIQISRLAHGVPVGGELDYLDEGTIATALKKRTA